MPTARERLRAHLNGHPEAPASWPHLHAALHAVAADPHEEAEALLRDAAAYEGHLRLEAGPGMPHAMSPEDMLRFVAVQALAERGVDRHRDVLQRAAALSDAESVHRAVADLTGEAPA